MPLYEYQCQKCQKVHELIQKFSDPPLEKCEDCEGPVQKLMSLNSFSLKGQGWYTTDYKKSSAPRSEEKSNGESKSASGDSTKSEKSEKPAKSEKPEKPEKKEASKTDSSQSSSKTS